LYHGLGSGKTCTSIAIAEGMKSGKKIVLMTPASLKMNFFNELKKCGDVLYKKNQFWEFISLEGEPQRAVLLAQVLGLDTDFVRKQGGAWLMNVKKKANFADLSDRDQKSVDQQLDHMIRNKYIDINYNGLQQHHIEEMTHGGKVNPFDNKVVIIDEAHNLVSRISNTGSKRGSIAYRLYRDLMDATNVKIIFLTGTPIINTPHEIAILFNMLRGFIKTWTFFYRPRLYIGVGVYRSTTLLILV
jgi:SNF2 family DNA or RNA helicase